MAVIPSSSQFLVRRLKELRIRCGLTQSQFAEVAGLTLKVYQHIEAGRRSNLQLKTLDRLAWAYSIELYQLFAPEIPKIKLAIKPPVALNRRAK